MITRYSYLLGVVLTNRRDLLPKGCCRLCCYGLLIGRCIDNYSQEIVWHNISNAIAHRFFVQFKSMFVLKYHTRFKTFVRLIRLLSFIIIWVSFSVIQVLRYFYVTLAVIRFDNFDLPWPYKVSYLDIAKDSFCL